MKKKIATTMLGFSILFMFVGACSASQIPDNQIADNRYEPPETITLNVPSNNITHGYPIDISGTVPSSVPDGSLIRIEIFGVDEPTVFMLPDVARAGKFSCEFLLDEPGAYMIRISFGTEYDRGYIVSPMKEITIVPQIPLPLQTFYFDEGGIFIRVGEEVDINSLALLCSGANNVPYNVANPRFGARYAIEDPQIARIDDEKIIGLNLGATRLSAVFKGYIAYLNIEVF